MSSVIVLVKSWIDISIESVSFKKRLHICLSRDLLTIDRSARHYISFFVFCSLPCFFPLILKHPSVHPFILKHKHPLTHHHSQLNWLWLWAEIKFPFMIKTAQSPLIYPTRAEAVWWWREKNKQTYMCWRWEVRSALEPLSGIIYVRRDQISAGNISWGYYRALKTYFALNSHQAALKNWGFRTEHACNL